MSSRLILLILHAFAFEASFAQSPAQSAIAQYKDSLNTLARIMQREGTDSARTAASAEFHSMISFILNDSSSFSANFDSIPNLSVRTAPDGSFRLYSWMSSTYDGSAYFYYGFIQTKKNKKFTLIPLTDSSMVLEKPLSRKLKPGQWYGVLYYSILMHERKGKKIYTLFGWKGLNQTTTRKVIDVLTFESNKPVFGFPVFKVENIYHHRILFEYTSQAVMSLKYVPEKKLMVFDHISRSALTGLVGPDGTYDAFKYLKNYWEFIPDVDVDAGFIPRKKDFRLYKDDELNKENK